MWCTSWLAMVVAFVKMATISCHSRTISVNLDAKWSHTPLLLEASEFLAQESNDLFWKFVNDIADLPEFQKASREGHHDEALYHLATKLAGRLLSPLQLNLLEFSLALRSNSPAVEMYNQIAHDLRPPGECDAFVEVNNIVTCERMALTAFIEAAKAQAKPILVKQDHYYPGSEGRDVTVILYAQMGKPSFYEWHTMLRKLADDGVISYVLRHYVKEGAPKKVRLSGYGVELAIKSTEYKAKDDTKVEGGADLDEEEDIQGFYFNRLKKLHPDLVEELTDYRQHLVDSVEGMAPLKVWQLQDLSFQAAQRVVSSEPDKALQTLRDISQNFPTMARTLVRSSVSDKLRKEVFANQQRLTSELNLSPGDNVMFINGLQADLEVFDVFNLLETLRSEAKLMEGLYGLAKQYSVSQDKLTALLRLDLRDRDSNYAVDTRDPSVVYINDLEKDKKYSGWPGSVQDLLRPTFPGMLRHIRRNLFHLIFCVNPADSNSRELLKMAEAFYVHNAPARIGFVFVVDEADEAGVAMVNAFHYISETQSGSKALSFITDVYQRHAKDITADKVQLLFKAAKPKVNVEEVFGEDSPYNSLRQESTAFFAQTGLASAPQVLLNGVPLSAEEISSDEFEEAVVTAILHQTPELQKAVYNGYLNDKTDALDYLMMRPNVMPRINARILATTTDFLDFSKDMPSTAVRNHDAFSTMSPPDMTAALLSSLKYLTKKDEESLRSVSIWVICDLDTPEGRDFLYSSIKHMKSTNNMRIAVIHNSALTDGAGPISKAVQVAIATLSPTMAKNFVTKLVKEENAPSILDGGLRELAVGGMDFDAYEQSLNAEDGSFVLTHRTACDKLLNLLPGQRAIIVNGKVLGPLGDDEQFQQADFALLEKYSHQTSAGKIMDKVKKMDIDGSMGSELVMKADALLSSVPQKESRKDVQFAGEEHSVLKIPPHEDGPAYEVVAIFDPATRAAQKYTPLIMVLQEVANVNIKVFLNCRDKLSEMPLNSFYRYVLEPRMKFAVDSSVASGPMAHFRDMPLKPILTLGMDPPESWLVEAVRTAYDLDNIHLEEVEGRVDADFELEYLLLEGHCHDSSTGQPPRGLQYTLGTQNKPAVVDTIVMANLGYFQLKATPGMWFLRMRGGRSEEIFEVISHDNTDSPEGSSEVIVVMDSFKSKIIRVKVSKKAGMEDEDLLAEGTQPEMGLWDSISSKLTGTKAVESTEETINIFSLASGHLYERFLRIMMTSVLKHTKSKVKFWFLKNYLSPSFKDFIPHMAKEYNFEYELVQYKWPRWLHQQREKQRIIWGYKILFLDVLFPLSINKIIFVDADQIVRTDLKELCDFDLEGAPYGYTPFCESRKEMDGFRFWKSGYWASHLAGRKYHISALYVVDLKKFRKIAAGDRLRGQYQGLSQDPNSLSNLDQDLPNNMIHQVGIKSLPQEWLWCETWCSTSELKNAKTIDLCNNPQTKEPKLTAAQRIVPEWTEYDQQIKSLWDRVYKTNNSDKSTSEPQLDSDSNRDEL